MAVLCEAISVVARRDSIDAFYKGGWDCKKSLLQFVDEAELENRYEFLRTENGLDVFRDIKTGKEVCKLANNPNE